MLQLYFRYKMQNKFVLTRYFKYKITELPAEYRAHRADIWNHAHAAQLMNVISFASPTAQK